MRPLLSSRLDEKQKERVSAATRTSDQSCILSRSVNTRKLWSCSCSSRHFYAARCAVQPAGEAQGGLSRRHILWPGLWKNQSTATTLHIVTTIASNYANQSIRMGSNLALRIRIISWYLSSHRYSKTCNCWSSLIIQARSPLYST